MPIARVAAVADVEGIATDRQGLHERCARAILGLEPALARGRQAILATGEAPDGLAREDEQRPGAEKVPDLAHLAAGGPEADRVVVLQRLGDGEVAEVAGSGQVPDLGRQVAATEG
jgi:hypothetical protein